MTSKATTDSTAEQMSPLLRKATSPEPTALDARLRPLKRDEILRYPRARRLRWFYLMQCKHSELSRVTQDLLELLEPDNETNIVSILGMTGIGKTTLANSLVNTLSRRFFGEAGPGDVPVVYVKAPANGERSLSWRTLYSRMLYAGSEPLIGFKRRTVQLDGRLYVESGSRATVAALRESLEEMLIRRNVRVVIIDEALHLLRFSDYAAVMDTLKSLADAHSTKLLIIGPHVTVEMIQQYGQVAKRSEVIHYRRYMRSVAKDRDEFRRVVAKLQELWPCTQVPNLAAIADELMAVTLGSVGLLKQLLLKLASLQMLNEEVFAGKMLGKSCKSKTALQKLEEEVVQGESLLVGASYGDSPFADSDVLKRLLEKMDAPATAT